MDVRGEAGILLRKLYPMIKTDSLLKQRKKATHFRPTLRTTSGVFTTNPKLDSNPGAGSGEKTDLLLPPLHFEKPVSIVLYAEVTLHHFKDHFDSCN